MEEQPQQKRKTIDPVYPPKDKKNEIAAKTDAAMDIEEDKNSSKFGVLIQSFNVFIEKDGVCRSYFCFDFYNQMATSI